MQINQHCPRHGGGDLARRLRVGRAAGRLAESLAVLERVELRGADLVQRRGRDEEDLGVVRRDVRVRDDAAQVGAVHVQREALVVDFDLERSVVGAEEDELWFFIWFS